MIDLRSDTVTRPSRAMLEEMMAAPVGTTCTGMTLPLMLSSNTPLTFQVKKRRYFYPPAPRPTSWRY